MRVEEQAPHLLMCPPDFFEVAYVINPWMNPAQWALDAKQLSREAVVGWKALKSLYQRLGAQVTIQPPAPGLPDLVFTANCAVVLDGKAVLARFLNDERRGEEVHDQRVFEQLRARGVINEFHRTPPGVYFEGVGDALFDPQRRLMWMGFGQRSSRCAHHTIEQFFGIATVSLELVDPCYYHLNTSLCLLSGGEILYYPQAFTDQGREQIEYLARDRLIAVSPDDAAGLGVNAVCIGRELVLGHCSPVLREQLRALGYRVHEVPLGAFHRAGGAACCLTLPLHHRSRPRVLGAQRLAP